MAERLSSGAISVSKEECEIMVATEGSVRAAAKKIGVHHKTLGRYLTSKSNGNGHAIMEENPLLALERSRALEAQAQALLLSAVKSALACVDGNVRRAADLLEMPHRTLDSMIRSGRLSSLKSLIRHKPGRPKNS